MLSVIVPCYNSARTLRACLDSLWENLREYKQGSYEVLVPVRDSIDGTYSILEEYDVKVLRHNKAGISAAYNLGVESARGDLGVFLNSDDELGPGFLDRVVSAAMRDADVRTVVYTSILFIDVNGVPLYWRHPAPYVGWIHQRCSIIMHPNAVYPMHLLRKYPFEILPGNPPRDREQVYALMQEARAERTRAVHYRYRIWSSSGTVAGAKKPRARVTFAALMGAVLARSYVQLYETHKLSRILGRRTGAHSHWLQPNEK